MRTVSRFFAMLRFLAAAWIEAVTRGAGKTREEQAATRQRWSLGILKACGLGFSADGPGLEGLRAAPSAMIAANHASWLDPFAVCALRPAAFVAKSEIASWPFLGRLVAASGTVFIRRSSKRAILEVNRKLVECLQSPSAAGFFPEGTTGPGTQLLPFHPNLLEAACVSGSPVYPVLIRYMQGGRPSQTASYHSVSLLVSALRVFSARDLSVHVTVLAPISPAGRSRHEVCDELRAAMVQAYDAPAGGEPAGTASGREA